MEAITKAQVHSSTIGEASRQSGVHIETIRYYEKIRLLPPPPRSDGGRRIYGQPELRTLTFIRRARELGLTIEDIRTLLDLGGPGQASCSQVCAVATRHLDSVRSKIADLQKLERFLNGTISRCSGTAGMDCAVLDALYRPEAAVSGEIPAERRTPVKAERQ